MRDKRNTGGSRMKRKGKIIKREGEVMGDWRAAGELNGGQASEGEALSGQCVSVCDSPVVHDRK